MTWRGPAVLLVLLALGAGGGFGTSLLLARQPAAGGVPTPVAAASPGFPADPEPTYVADPDVPPLPTDLETTRGRIGTRDFRVEFPVPRGWRATPNNANETKWTDPANPPAWTYVLRVEQVGSQNKSITALLETRIADLDSDEEDFRVVGRTADSLTFSYTADEHLRYGVLRWLDLDDSDLDPRDFADLEVAVTGREVDLPGMEALLARVTGDVRRR